MKLKSLLIPLLSLPFYASGQNAAPSFAVTPDSPFAEELNPSLGEVIGGIAENADRDVADYDQIAQLTLQLGQAALQQGQRLPDSSIWDGIHAVDEGESIDALHTDWATLRTELEKLLEKPPESEDESQQEENSENEEQENQDQQENSDSQDNQSGEQNSEENQDSQGEESESNEGEPSGEQNQDPQSSDQEQNGENSENGQTQEQDSQGQTGENLGDMDESEETPELDQKQPEKKEEQTQVGGTEQKRPPRSAKQAMTLQQLEQLKQQDKPGALHMLLQNAEQDEKAEAPKKLEKDW